MYFSTCNIFDHGVSETLKMDIASATTPTYLTLRDNSCSGLLLSLSDWSSIWTTLRIARKKRMRFETQAHDEEDF